MLLPYLISLFGIILLLVLKGFRSGVKDVAHVG